MTFLLLFNDNKTSLTVSINSLLIKHSGKPFGISFDEGFILDKDLNCLNFEINISFLFFKYLPPYTVIKIS